MESIYKPIESEITAFKSSHILVPELWRKFNTNDLKKVDFSKWEKAKMMNDIGGLSDETNDIPTSYGGIYVYTVEPDIIPKCASYIMYIGMASKTKNENLRYRVRSYKKEFGKEYTRDRIHNLFYRWGKYVYVYYLPIDSDSETIKELETRLIGCFIPPCNPDIRDVEVKKKVKAFVEF